MTLLADIQSVLTDDLLKGRWKRNPRPLTNPLAGHCYVAAEALWHSLPDRQDWMPMCLSFPDEKGRASHWWLQHKSTGTILDPTREQFSYDFPYELGRGCGFLTKAPSKRAQIVLDRLQKASKIDFNH